jgi:hypothetical protein
MAVPHPHPTDRVGYVHGGSLVEFRHQDTDVLIGESAMTVLPPKEATWWHGVGEDGALTEYDIKAVKIESRQYEVDDDQGDPQDVGVALCYTKYIVLVKEPAP